MLQFPAIPSWDALHPLIIHFPIALLLIAPIFIVVGAVLTPAKGRSYLIAAMVLLLVGTASIFVAVQPPRRLPLCQPTAKPSLQSGKNGPWPVSARHQRL